MMSDESTQEDELTVEDILAEASEAPYHTILEVWQQVLKPVAAQRDQRITPQWASRICSTHREINFADMPAFSKQYFDRISELAKIVDVEIDSDEECLNLTSPEEDVEHNSHHYKNILTDWQKALLFWELEWDCASPDAAIELASISEVHRMFFDQTGLTSLLDNIQFEYTEADSDQLAAELQALRESVEG